MAEKIRKLDMKEAERLVSSIEATNIHQILLTLSQILDSPKFKEFADDNFNLDVNGRTSSRQVENSVGKVEIACYEQFSLSHSIFKRLVMQIRKKESLFWKGLTEFQIWNLKICQDV